MIKRLSIVLWWIGALTIAVSVLFGGLLVRHHYKIYECGSVFAEETELRKRLESKIEAEKSAGKDPVAEFLNSGGTTLPVSPKPEFQKELSECENERNRNPLLGLVTCLVLSLSFLFAAYILGGSFFRPPKEL